MAREELLPLTTKNVAFSSALKLIQNRNGSVSGAYLVIFGFRHYIQSIICRYIYIQYSSFLFLPVPECIRVNWKTTVVALTVRKEFEGCFKMAEIGSAIKEVIT